MKKHIVALLVCLAGFGQAASANDAYPSKPIRLVVGFSSGGSTDGIARLLARHMSEQLGQPVVVENRAGAGGGIALQQVAAAPADGYTLILLTASSTTLGLTRKVSFDIEKDFTPIGQVAVGPQVLAVTANAKVRSVADLVALAKSKPGELGYGTSGAGTPSHLVGVLLSQSANIKLIHVPFKGSSENIIATAAGDVTMSFTDAVSTMPMLNSGKAIALGVTTAKRASFLPAVPTLEESGLKGVVVPLWFGVAGPANMPADVTAKLYATINKLSSAAGVTQPLNNLGVDPQSSTPEEFRAFIRAEVRKNAELIKASGMKVE